MVAFFNHCEININVTLSIKTECQFLNNFRVADIVHAALHQ